MITITDNFSYAANELQVGSRVIIVSENAPGVLPGAIHLPVMLPPSEILFEFMNDIERYPYQNCLSVLQTQYTDYLLSNDIVNQTLFMLALSGINNDIVIYLNSEDMHNETVPFFGILLNYISKSVYGICNPYGLHGIEIEFTPYSALNAALSLYNNMVISLDVVLKILDWQYSLVPPNIAFSLLNFAYGESSKEFSVPMQQSLSKYLLKKSLLGINIKNSKQPAFWW